MRKTGPFISVLLVLVFLTASCSQGTDNSLTENSVGTSTGETTSAASLTTPAESTSKEVSANTNVTKTDSTTASPSVPSPTPSPKPSAALIPDENLIVILDQITNMEVGTAGASFKSAALSGSVLDWVESSSLSTKDKKMNIDAYLQDLGDEAYVDLFIMNFESVSATAQLIINKDDATLGMLLEAGYTLKHPSYTQVKWDEFVSAVQSTADEY